MNTEQLAVRIELPKPGDMDFDNLVESLADAVYEKVKERLENESRGARNESTVT